MWLVLLVWACGDKDDDSGDGGGGGGDGCVALCTDAGFDGGTEEEFEGGVVECQCSGGSGTVEQAACTSYCADHDVSEANALLSGTDKCVCDGTQE